MHRNAVVGAFADAVEANKRDERKARFSVLENLDRTPATGV